jgi:hypothetical protein
MRDQRARTKGPDARPQAKVATSPLFNLDGMFDVLRDAKEEAQQVGGSGARAAKHGMRARAHGLFLLEQTLTLPHAAGVGVHAPVAVGSTGWHAAALLAWTCGHLAASHCNQRTRGAHAPFHIHHATL